MPLLRETGIVFARAARPTLRNPAAIAIGVSQPVLYLALFGPLVRHVAGPTPGNSWQWFVPGIMVQLTLFGTAYAGFALIPEIRSGTLERLRVTPVSRAALLLGRVLRDVALLLAQAVLIAAASTVLGFRAPIGGLLAGLALLAVLGLAVGSASYALALKLRHEYAFAPVLATTVVPLMLLSGVLLPMSLAPGWLRVIAAVNPLSHIVDAERAVVAGQWHAQAVWLGPLVGAALAAGCVAWGVRAFRAEN